MMAIIDQKGRAMVVTLGQILLEPWIMAVLLGMVGFDLFLQIWKCRLQARLLYFQDF